MKKFAILLLIMLFNNQLNCYSNVTNDMAHSALDGQVGSLPQRPWTFWYWMYGAVSDDGIRADLKAMKDVNIGGFYLMPIKDSKIGPQYEGTCDQLTPEWWKRIDTVYRVADSLKLEMGIHFSDGFALGGGPWITEDESMQKICATEKPLKGRWVRANDESIRHKNTIAVFALRDKFHCSDSTKPRSSVEFPFSSKVPCEIVFDYEKPFTARSVTVVTGGNNIQAHNWKVFASIDGKHYDFVRDIKPARRGWQDTGIQTTYSLPETRARFFKFCWNPEGSDPGSEDLDAAKWKPNLKVADIQLSSQPVVDNWQAKNGGVWRVAEEVDFNNPQCYYQPEDIIEIPAGKDIKLPKGQWKLLNIYHETTGQTNATGGGGKGLECDKFSREAIDKQFDNWFAAIYKHVPSDVAARVLKRLHVDSWECGSQNWGKNFANEFKQRRGYDIRPWLPLYIGVPMVSKDKSEQVLRDIRLTIAELINDVFFTEVSRLAKLYGVQLSCECVAPTMVSDGMLHYQHADYPMGEFWFNSPTHDKPNDMLDAISGAHVYGKNLVQAEAFTEVRATWDETPAMLKPSLDRAFCMGINSIVFHVNTHNPYMDKQPGMTLDGIGNFFQRDNTWWREMKAFNEYIFLCQGRLQSGQPVADIAVYTGDEVPRRALLPERLVSSLPGLFGQKLIEQEKLRLENAGLPMEVSPVGVNHTKNMTKIDMFTNPLHGYKYDSFNHDALRNARVENGELITRDGMHYKVLVVPQVHKLNPNNIITCHDDIERLKSQGLKVIETPWTEADLTSLGIEKDANLPEGLDYAHRTEEGEDNYFVSNLTDHPVTFSPKFRAQRNYTYLMYPTLNRGFLCPDTLTLHPHESVIFIIRDEELDSETFRPNRKDADIDFGQWTVEFEKTGKKFNLSPTLSQVDGTVFDWSQQEDDATRYYSGRAIYSTTFNLPSPPLSPQGGMKGYQSLPLGGAGRGLPMVIDLGKVCDIATVYLNGERCETVWTEPYEVELTRELRPGKNELRIEVVNTWANALLGTDLGTPPFPGIWTNGKYRRAEKTLLPAGLLGPVKLKYKY